MCSTEMALESIFRLYCMHLQNCPDIRKREKMQYESYQKLKHKKLSLKEKLFPLFTIKRKCWVDSQNKNVRFSRNIHIQRDQGRSLPGTFSHKENLRLNKLNQLMFAFPVIFISTFIAVFGAKLWLKIYSLWMIFLLMLGGPATALNEILYSVHQRISIIVNEFKFCSSIAILL